MGRRGGPQRHLERGRLCWLGGLPGGASRQGWCPGGWRESLAAAWRQEHLGVWEESGRRLEPTGGQRRGPTPAVVLGVLVVEALRGCAGGQSGCWEGTRRGPQGSWALRSSGSWGGWLSLGLYQGGCLEKEVLPLVFAA